MKRGRNSYNNKKKSGGRYKKAVKVEDLPPRVAPPPLSLLTGLSFTAAPAAELEPSLAQHLASVTAQTAKFDGECYTYHKGGRPVRVGGLNKALRWRYYAHYQDNRSKRDWKTTKIKGSSKEEGILVDTEVSLYVENRHRLVTQQKARRLLATWEAMGHTLQAGQVPVELPVTLLGGQRLTQADLITRHRETGELWLWEIKCGAPIGFHRKQGVFANMPEDADDVACTKLGIWHLQLHFTCESLKAAGVDIRHARVIQIHENKVEGLRVDIHEPPAWVAKNLPRH